MRRSLLIRRSLEKELTYPLGMSQKLWINQTMKVLVTILRRHLGLWLKDVQFSDYVKQLAEILIHRRNKKYAVRCITRSPAASLHSYPDRYHTQLYSD